MKFRKRENCYYISSFNEREYEHTDWAIFYWGWQFDISYQICGYFDNRPRINLDLFFFSLTLVLPFRNKWTDECDSPKWGVSYHSKTLWIHRGGKGNMNGGSKWWTIYMPWQPKWVRTSNLRIDQTWEHETRGNNKNFYEDKWREVIWHEQHPYAYTLKSGEVQQRTADIKVEEREWRWHWFQWLPLTKSVTRSIAIDFSGEVGEGTGSWKGGTVGCSYELLPHETPFECLRRMERERTFR